MKLFRLRITLLFFSILVLGAEQGQDARAQEATPLEYTVDLNDRTGDTFKVTLSVNDLGPENAVYQFASTAPGTYQRMDVGRFVRSFEAVDAQGDVILSENISTNQWRISDPESVSVIRYTVAETWDTPVDENPIFMMAGTSIEDDHVLINGQAVFGYPTGMQARPLRIQLLHPAGWMVGTALDSDETGTLLADDYDHVVDSPILMGRLSKASLDIRGSEIEVYTYSKTDKVHSDQILEAITDILDAAGDFLIELPVKRYTFLFHFEDVTMGAWEHSYSSEYVYAEDAFEMAIAESIPSVVAHEFFHVVTPLNIHSEIVEYFNFVEPVASEHIWLYEGTTEWASDIMQLRAGLIDLDNYLGRLSEKLNADDRYDKEYSLSDLGLNSYSTKGQQQWGNIYQRGALVSGLLDLKILELSGGARGLREVILDLAARYGPDTSFVESTFFEEFAEMTYPEVLRILERHVRGTDVLPMAEYYQKIGIEYVPEFSTGEQIASFGMQVGLDGTNLVLVGVGEIAEGCGLALGDALVGFDGMEVTLQTAQHVLAAFHSIAADEDFTIKIRRGEKEHEFTCAKRMVDRIDKHVFRVDSEATPEQVALRTAWMKNLQQVDVIPAVNE